MFMLNNVIRPLIQDNPPPRILLLRLSPIFIGLFIILPVALFMRSQRPPTDEWGMPLPSPLQEFGAIGPDSTASGTLAPGERHAWTLDGVKGQRIAITLDGAWDSHLALYMPDGIQKLTQDGYSAGNGQAWIDGVTLPTDGQYTVVVSGENGGAGSYELRLTEAKPASPPIHLKVGPSDGPLLITG